MADKSTKWEDNVDGKFYVDEECIACDLCCGEAPDFFEMNDEGHAFVVKQPNTAEEIQECQSALDDCPVEAIGDDGS